MIGHPILRKVVSPNSFAAIAGPNQSSSHFGTFILHLCLLCFQNTAPQHAHGLGAVLVLALFILAFDDNPGR